MASQKSESVIRDLFELAGVEINGTNPWDIQIHDPRLYDRLLRETSLGLGEAYMDGWWDSELVDQLIAHLLTAGIEKKVKGNWKIVWQLLKGRLINLQSPARAYEVGRRHYDLGNELYTAMLDKRLTYSCGYWKTANNLNEAQEAKLDLVCQKIGLQPGMKVLDIGCGWGSFAKFAAERYGAQVVGITISKEQIALGSELCKGLSVELRLEDYRLVSGEFDSVISIGSLEHIGYKNYRTYMEVVDRVLKKDGIALIHTIGSNTSVTAGEPWTDKYIFPNGLLPSIAQLGDAMEEQFVMEDWHNFGPYYDKTLMAWEANFENSWNKLIIQYDERFHRMWRYYLLSSAGSFRVRNQQLWQIILTRRGTPQPNCRIS